MSALHDQLQREIEANITAQSELIATRDALQAAEARASALEADMASTIRNCDATCDSYAKENQQLFDRAEMAEARVKKLEEAITEARSWHEASRKALLKQPSSADGLWRRSQHEEQIDALSAALSQVQEKDGPT